MPPGDYADPPDRGCLRMVSDGAVGLVRVYRVHGDINRYQALLANDPDIWWTDRLPLTCVPKGAGSDGTG